MAQAPTAVTVPTWRYDVTHIGQNTSETALTPANVNGNTFGKLFSIPVDGYVYAQPLYVKGLTMGDGLVHNVVFIATEHDSVYAFDADSNSGANANPLWHITLLDAAHGATAGATTVPSTDVNSDDITPEIGITGTPVINPATNTLYVVGKTKENGTYFQRLHAINILTGAEQANSPTMIQATVSGTGDGSTSGRLPFDPLWENQRTALDYYNGHVYFAFSAHGDNGPYHGWVMAYDATTLAQTAAVCVSPNGVGNGVWMSGAGMPIDTGGTAGRLFLTTGNGSYVSYPPFNLSSEFGDSTIAFDLSNGGLAATDAFTAFNQAYLTQNDFDQGSGGILMLPDQPGPYPHILLQAGKEGRIVVLNRDNLGGFATGATSNTNALQDISQVVLGIYSTPAYWNGSVYIWARGDFAKMFTVTNGVMNTTPSSKSSFTAAFPGASFVLSSSGTQNGIAWAARTDQFATNGAQVLYAFDATNLANLLYESDTNVSRDGAGPAVKFSVPVVTNGKVYLAAEYRLDVYGLLNSQPVAVAPVITPNGGAFAAAQNVTLSSTTTGAKIYYTLDGTTPTITSTLYAGPISISTNETIRAIAVATGYTQSAESRASFTFSQQTPTVSFLPLGGTYTATQNVTLSDTDTAAAIYYTTDGTPPTASSHLYTGPIPVAVSMTINAIAIDPSLQNSAVAASAYIIQAGGSALNFGSGFSSAAGLFLNRAAAVTGNMLQLTNGATWQSASVYWNQPVPIQAFTTDFNFQLLNAQADGFTFTIQNTGGTALGQAGSGLGYGAYEPSDTSGGIGHSVAVKFDIYNNNGEGTDSTGFYTNGASPTIPATDVTPSGVTLTSGHVLHAHITYDGTNLTLVLTDTTTSASFTKTAAINIPSAVGADTAYVGFTASTGGSSMTSDILNWTYVTSAQTQTTAAPVFSPQGGNYTTPQNVALSSTTSGAVIYYTTNGTTPTTASSVYNSALAVGTGTTAIEAIAVANGSQSAVTTAQYIVQPLATAAPTFSPAAGSYSTAQNVALADSTTGAVIHYTTNGTTPTTASPVYSSAIAVGTGTTMIEAIAVANGSQSAVTTAQYIVQPPVTAAPVFNPAGGNYTTAQNIALADSTTGAVIYYTTNGTTPITGSPVYSSAIAVGTGTTTIEAIAVANGSQSAVTTAQYIVQPPVTAAPVFNPAGGNYTTAQNVALADSTTGAVIYYTTNGTTPTTASSVYTVPIHVAATETLQAIAAAPNSQTSAIATAAYTIQPTLVVDFSNGFSSIAGLTLNGADTTGGSVFWNLPVSIQAFTTDFNFQLLSAQADGFTFTIQNTGVNALGPGGSGLGYGATQPGGTGGIGRSVAVKFDIQNNDGEGSDSTGFYTNGASPTIPATDMTASGVTLNSGHVIHAHITYDGTNLTLVLTDTVTSASFTQTEAINIPSTVGASTAYVGFTSGAGGTSSNLNFLNWTVTNP